MKSVPQTPVADAPSSPHGYEIIRELGRGGMSVVYQARQLQLNRLVALKMLRAGSHAGPEVLTRFRREAEIIARVQHPNIVQIFEVGMVQGQPFLALEFCPGGSLAHKLQGTPMPPREAAELVETLAQALHALHQEQVLHRDLKPANVLLAADGTPKISDFGLARTLTDPGQTPSGTILGTPSYMAPEQAAGPGIPVGPAADVYALGAILYELLTGRPPFKAATPLDTIVQVVAEEPVPPSQLQGQTPRDLETICLKCLRKEAGQRYATAEDLVEDLRRFLAGEPVRARPVGRLEGSWRWCRRNPALAAVLAVALLLLSLGTTLSTMLALRETRARSEAEKAAGIADEERVKAVAARNERDAKHTALGQVQAKLEASNEELLSSMARGLLRPLAAREKAWDDPTWPLSDQERAALWDLARTPEELLRLRFIQEAVRTPLGTRQLKDRADFALLAAVGLDAARRRQVERILAEAMQSQEVTPEQQRDLALVLARLGVQDQGLLLSMARVLLEAMSRIKDQNDPGLVEAFLTVASRLEPATAGDIRGQAAAALSQAMIRTRNPEVLSALGQGLATVAAQLPPREAAQVCAPMARLLVAELSKTARWRVLRDLARCLATVAAWMEPAEAALVCGQAARTLAQPMDRTKPNTFDMDTLAIGLAALAPRLEPREAFALLARAWIQKELKHKEAFVSLTTAQRQVVSRLEPREAVVLLAQFLASIGEWNQVNGWEWSSLPDLEQALEATAARLSVGQADRECGPAAEALLQAIRTKGPVSWPLLAQALAAVAARLEPPKAAQVCGPATQFFIHQLGTDRVAQAARSLIPLLAWVDSPAALAALFQARQKSDHWEVEMLLGRCTAALAVHLPPREALEALSRAIPLAHYASLDDVARSLATVARQNPEVAAEATAILLEAMTRRNYPSDLAHLGQGLIPLPTRLTPQQSSQVAASLLDALTRETHTEYQLFLARTLSTVAGWLQPREADQVRSKAGAFLLRALGKAPRAEDLAMLKDGLAYLAVGMESKEAASLLQEMRETLDPKADWPRLVFLTTLVSHLDPNETTAAAATLFQLMTRREHQKLSMKDLKLMEECLAEILCRQSTIQSHQRRLAVAGAVGWASDPGSRLAASTLLQPALQPLPPPLPVENLVELIKNPFCVGLARRLVLDQLARHFGRSFADPWDLVRVAQQQKLGLDFTSAPRPPNP